MQPNEIAFFENYIVTHPDSAYLPQLARIYLENGELELAIDCCQKELTARPYSPYGHYLWALAALKKGDTPQAVAELQATIKNDPTFLAAYYQLLINGEPYLDKATYQLCLRQIRRLNPLDQETIKKYERQLLGTGESAIPPTTEEPVQAIAEAEPITPQPSLMEPTELEGIAPVETPSHAPVALAEEEAHLGPLDTELPKEPEPVNFEVEPPTVAPIGGAPPSLTELFQKFKTKSIDELQQEAVPQPHPEPVVTPAPEPQPAVETEPPQSSVEPAFITVEEKSPLASGTPSDIAKLFEKMRTTPIDLLHKEEWIVPPVEAKPGAPPAGETPPSPEAGSPPISEPAAAPTPETAPIPPTATEKTSPEEVKSKRPATKSARSTKKAAGTSSDGANEITIKFPIPTWTLVEVLKKQGLYPQALEIITMIETKTKKAEDLEKAQQMRQEIEKLMTEGQA